MLLHLHGENTLLNSGILTYTPVCAYATLAAAIQ